MAYRNGSDKSFRPIGGGLGRTSNRVSHDEGTRMQLDRDRQYGYRLDSYAEEFPALGQNTTQYYQTHMPAYMYDEPNVVPQRHYAPQPHPQQGPDGHEPSTRHNQRPVPFRRPEPHSHVVTSRVADAPRFRPRPENNIQGPDLSDDLFRHVQLANHLRNWERIPKAINSRLTQAVSTVTVPMTNEDFRNSLESAVKACESQLQKLVRGHLQQQLERVSFRLFVAEASGEQLEAAKHMAKHRVSQRTSHRNNSITNNFIEDACRLVNRKTNTRTAHRQQQQQQQQLHQNKQNSTSSPKSPRPTVHEVATVGESILAYHEEMELQEALDESRLMTVDAQALKTNQKINKQFMSSNILSTLEGVAESPSRKRTYNYVDSDSEESRRKGRRSPRLVLRKVGEREKTPAQISKRALSRVASGSATPPLTLSLSPESRASSGSLFSVDNNSELPVEPNLAGEEKEVVRAKKQLFKDKCRGARGVSDPDVTWTVTKDNPPGMAEEVRGGNRISIRLYSGTKTLVVGGSNLRSVERRSIPTGWHVSLYSWSES